MVGFCFSGGMHESSLLQTLRSCISWGNTELYLAFQQSKIMDNNCSACCNCESNLSKSNVKYECRSCRKLMCGSCIQGSDSFDGVKSDESMETCAAICITKLCKLCFELNPLGKSGQSCCSKVHPSDSPRQNPEPPSPSFSGENFGGHSPREWTRSSDASVLIHSSPSSVHGSPTRSEENDREDAPSHFFISPGGCLHGASDVDSGSASARHEFYSFMSVGSIPSDDFTRLNTSSRIGQYVQEEHGETHKSQNNDLSDQDQSVLERPPEGISVAENSKHENFPKSFDFESNGLIWLTPPPSDVDDEAEKNIFTYDDEDDEVGDSGAMFSPAAVDNIFLSRRREHLDHRELWKTAVEGHFRALVSQLFEGHGIIAIKDNCNENWLDIVTALAWQAAKFVKPDRSKGSSMDPCDYLKVKCVASGRPSESKFIKGVVCTKNIKHKRMMTHYKNARLLLLGGALEYQRVPNKLASFEKLLQQENDHLKAVVSKIEAHHPNVLLVEKSVSSFALEHLLAKEISLVLNVKRPLLERIAQCTGAILTPSTDHISTTRLGYCELFHLEKISEEHELANQFNRRPSKTLMYFEGCPWRLGCTIMLRGSHREELKKVKHVVQYAVFAAYHLLLETSFLADEGASLPTLASKSSTVIPTKIATEKVITVIPDSEVNSNCKEEFDVSNIEVMSVEHSLELGLQESLSELSGTSYDHVSLTDEFRYRKVLSEACDENLALDLMLDEKKSACLGIGTHTQTEVASQGEGKSGEAEANVTPVELGTKTQSEYVSANDSHQSILVSFTSHHTVNGTICERSRLLRLKFYGPSDKPLGRYLRDLFDQSYLCLSCKESAEAHVLCYTHQQANLIINVRHLPSVKLPGEQDGKIWMWHRCLRCAHIEGVPPATKRVVMSNAAEGLSFGKFLELSFSNQATGNRVASCGHSLQRDCLRFYGFGSKVAFFRYSPINIMSIHLPPSILEFGSPQERSLITKEANELLSRAEALYNKTSSILDKFILKSLKSNSSELHSYVLDLIDTISEKRRYYQDMLQLADQLSPERDLVDLDMFEINHLHHSLLMDSQVWDRRLYSLNSLLNTTSSLKASHDTAATIDNKRKTEEHDSSLVEPCMRIKEEVEMLKNGESGGYPTPLHHYRSIASILPDQIDSAWTGADQAPTEAQLLDALKTDVAEASSYGQLTRKVNPSFRRLTAQTRVYSFDSAQRLQERIRKGLPPSLDHFRANRSFHASGSYRYMLRDPVMNLQRSTSHVPHHEAEKANISSSSSFISSVPLVPEGARLMVLQNGQEDVVLTIYDSEPTSIISYALCSKEYKDWVSDAPSGPVRGSSMKLLSKMNSLAPDLSTFSSFGSLDLNYTDFGSYIPEDTCVPTSQNSSPHVRISFEDESFNSAGKTKFTVMCYFAKQFDALQRRCCPSIMDFIHSLTRCKRWSAQGGKSNVYFAKSFDDRFIIKQVTKTELDSFVEFAPQYFKHLTENLSSGSPTCLAKILGMYQVNVKNVKGGKEVKMELMVMENLLFKKSISKVYDLKGSARSRYNSDTRGANKVLLDTNLLETLQTNPIFVGSRAKRRLERAIWNDTSFLAMVDVMDYSLLVGVDEEQKELVVGIIDYMRQYTWDKQLETWVKASGILGGTRNASPTIVSPTQYKKRFRKAMTGYFLAVPDQWSC